WIAGGVFPLTVVLMETLWIYPWLVWVGNIPSFKEPRPPLSLWSLLLLLGLSLFISRTFLSRGWRLGLVRLGIVVAGLVAVFISIRLEYDAGSAAFGSEWFIHTAQIFLDGFSRSHTLTIAPVIGVLVWWRGISWGRSPLDFRDIYRAFVVGLVALVFLIITRRAISFGEQTSSTGLYVAGFFLFGLSALALSNLQSIQQKMRAHNEAATLFSRRWIYLLFGVAVSVVLVGVAITSLLSREFVALLERFLGLAYNILLQVLGYLFVPLGYLADGLFRALQFIINLFRRDAPATFPSVNMSPISGSPESITPGAISPQVIMAIKWGIFALLIAALVFILVKAVSRYRASRDETDIDEFDESLWSWAGFRADVRLFLRAIRQNLGAKVRKPSSSKQAPLWHAIQFPDMMSIREIYRHLLREAAGVGTGRRRYETPGEYARRLGQVLPEGNEELSEITALYVGARYGELRIEEKQLGHANQLWKFLYGILDKLRYQGADY
ncbi:MAG: DUF4129 domain-containing protein, partial [Chloroflexi bacterium]|nr:DUF4129 domain-containing protein [Chloroflexota bacterium]